MAKAAPALMSHGFSWHRGEGEKPHRDPHTKVLLWWTQPQTIPVWWNRDGSTPQGWFGVESITAGNGWNASPEHCWGCFQLGLLYLGRGEPCTLLKWKGLDQQQGWAGGRQSIRGLNFSWELNINCLVSNEALGHGTLKHSSSDSPQVCGNDFFSNVKQFCFYFLFINNWCWAGGNTSIQLAAGASWCTPCIQPGMGQFQQIPGGDRGFPAPSAGNHHNFLEVSDFIVPGVLFALTLTQRSECAGGRERWLQGWRVAKVIFCRNKGGFNAWGPRKSCLGCT